jgi:hypothetical protein
MTSPPDDQLASVVGRLALAIAFIITVVLPVGYSILKYRDLVQYLDLIHLRDQARAWHAPDPGPVE